MKGRSSSGERLFRAWVIFSILWIGLGYFITFIHSPPSIVGAADYAAVARASREIADQEAAQEEFWNEIWRLPLTIFLLGGGIFWTLQNHRAGKKRPFEM